MKSAPAETPCTPTATPRPWTLEVVKTSIGRVFKIGPLGNGAKKYACLYDDSYAGISNGDEQVKANAELIVRAVNSHEQLVAALDESVRVLVIWRNSLGDTETTLALTASIEQKIAEFESALTAAKGGR